MRVALTILALVLDLLCLLFMGAVVVFSHPGGSEVFGFGIFGTVVGANVPALVWSLVRRKPALETPAAADVFD